LAELGIERIVVLRFSREFARVSATDFLVKVLGAGAGLRGLWIGHDFRFGHRREGNQSLLERLGARERFDLVRVDALRIDGQPVSSTSIRSALREGRVEEAAKLLGRWPDLEGVVVTGRMEGKRHLVPTANLELPKAQCLPAPGVYAGEAEWDGRHHPAVMNLGKRPTLTNEGRLVPEVHVLGFDGDLRGLRLNFRLRRRLREERKFHSINELRDQIALDIAETRTLAEEWQTMESDLVVDSDL
jgi:riboflavin kinase/FMN adenylyltransferase